MRSSALQHVGIRADRNKAIAFDRDRLHAGVSVPHGDDLAVVVDDVRFLLRECGRTQRQAQQGYNIGLRQLSSPLGSLQVLPDKLQIGVGGRHSVGGLILLMD